MTNDESDGVIGSEEERGSDGPSGPNQSRDSRKTGGGKGRQNLDESRLPPSEIPHSEPFRLRDGALDADSHLGRMWRNDARQYIK